MVDHHQLAKTLSAESHAILIAIHNSVANDDTHPSRREIFTAAQIRSYSILDREIESLIYHRLLERTQAKKSRNLRLTSLGRGILAELLRPTQLTLA